MNLNEIKAEKEKMTSKLMEDCKVFFAFSNEQFTEGKTELREGEKYVSMGAGGYLPKGYLDQFLAGLEAIRLYGTAKVKEAKLQDAEILYELNNHECFYTGECEDVVDMFKGTYTEDRIVKVFRKNYSKMAASL